MKKLIRALVITSALVSCSPNISSAKPPLWNKFKPKTIHLPSTDSTKTACILSKDKRNLILGGKVFPLSDPKSLVDFKCSGNELFILTTGYYQFSILYLSELKKQVGSVYDIPVSSISNSANFKGRKLFNGIVLNSRELFCVFKNGLLSRIIFDPKSMHSIWAKNTDLIGKIKEKPRIKQLTKDVFLLTYLHTKKATLIYLSQTQTAQTPLTLIKKGKQITKILKTKTGFSIEFKNNQYQEIPFPKNW